MKQCGVLSENILSSFLEVFKNNSDSLLQEVGNVSQHMFIFWQGTDVCKNSFGICTHAQVCVPGEFPEVPGSAAAQVGRVLLKMHSIRSVPGVHSWIFSWSAYVQRVILEWEEVQECCIAPPSKAQFWSVGAGGLGVFHANTGLLCKIHEIVCRPMCTRYTKSSYEFYSCILTSASETCCRYGSYYNWIGLN